MELLTVGGVRLIEVEVHKWWMFSILTAEEGLGYEKEFM